MWWSSILIRFLSTENTEYLTKTTSLNTELDARLKDVYVTSQGVVIAILIIAFCRLSNLFEKWTFSIDLFNFSRLKISNRQNHCLNNERQSILTWATKKPIKYDREECPCFKRSISSTNINRIQMNGPLKKSPKRIKLSQMLLVSIS